MMNSEQCWLRSEQNSFPLIQPWTFLAQKLYEFSQKASKNVEVNTCNTFLLSTGLTLAFVSLLNPRNKVSHMESKEKICIRENRTLSNFQKQNHQNWFWKVWFLVLSASILKITHFGCFHCFYLLSRCQYWPTLNQRFSELFIIESKMFRNVQDWIRNVQKCS